MDTPQDYLVFDERFMLWLLTVKFFSLLFFHLKILIFYENTEKDFLEVDMFPKIEKQNFPRLLYINKSQNERFRSRKIVCAIVTEKLDENVAILTVCRY